MIEEQGASAVVETMTPKQRREVLDALVTEEPDLAARAIQKTERLTTQSTDPHTTGRRRREQHHPPRYRWTSRPTIFGSPPANSHRPKCADSEFGVEHPEEEAAALEQVRRYLAMYGNATAKWNDDDREFLEAFGVRHDRGEAAAMGRDDRSQRSASGNVPSASSTAVTRSR